MLSLKYAEVRTSSPKDSEGRVCDFRGGETEAGRRRIAIVDCTTKLSNLYAAVLRTQGYEVVFVATSGEEAVEASNSGRFADIDYLIMDYGTHGMKGLEVAEKIVSRNPLIRVIVASADRSIRTQVEAIGFKFVEKPFHLWEIFDLIA